VSGLQVSGILVHVPVASPQAVLAQYSESRQSALLLQETSAPQATPVASVETSAFFARHSLL